ncbi:tyrosine phosphatase family-domain-containing protein [Chaetomium fimeti]|uniref:Tyrosine phosphatase family-domain-containing protein n=1 Tax=Chaetomium fimeti TaxID=1854472 RepID=A0AAE0HKC5_9PEZI|nr:tyrosine phosphatase family-domain-containing protein [Chaetomium fimeti]
MSTGDKLVSKRTGRQAGEPQENRMARHEETASEARDRQGSSSTVATCCSSLEPSPMVRPTYVQQEVDDLELESTGRSGSELRDAFHPPTAAHKPDYSVRELERNLPAESRPANFGIVVPGVYRSSFPQSEDYAFIEGLKLRTIVTLVKKDFPQGYDAFLHRNGIKHVIFDMKGTKKEAIPTATMQSILRVVLDRRNHPLLIHCNHGKHRTGCVIGVVRKLSGWNLSNIITEYKAYAEPKAREVDIDYITGFELIDGSNLFRDPKPSFRVSRFTRAVIFAFFILMIWFVSHTDLAGDTITRGTEVRPRK